MVLSVVSLSSQDTFKDSLLLSCDCWWLLDCEKATQTTGKRGFPALCIDEMVRKNTVYMLRDHLRKKWLLRAKLNLEVRVRTE